MARANPARSPYAATRHLLRNLRNVRELRRNPLAREEFDGRAGDEALGAIADRVDAALLTHSARHVAILLRVDAERHDPGRVAKDLGLSTRQFYRERRRAHDAFYAAYRVGYRGTARVESNLAQQLLTRATSLADSGETDSAIAVFHDVLAAGGGSDVTCEAFLRLAEAEVWAHRFDRASEHLAASAGILRTNHGETGNACDAQHDAVAALTLLLRWFRDGPDAITRELDNARTRPFGQRMAFVLAAAALRRGESAKAAALLRRSTAGIETSGAPHVAVDCLTLQGELANFTAADPSVGESLYARAAALASAHGLRGREFFARHQHALTRWLRTRRAEDRRAYHEIADATDPSLPARLRSFLCFSAADIEFSIGDPQRSLSAARAAASLSTSRYERLSAHGLAAGALLRLGRLADAALQATHAAEAARAEGYVRTLSTAQRICAQAYFVQGNRPAARAAIEESIEYARRFASPYVFAKTQALWARIRA